MKDNKFDANNIHSVELNLLDGQVDIILRGLELYGYNLEFMLDSSDSSDETKQEKIAMLKYTYEQILASRAEQVSNEINNNLTAFRKIIAEQSLQEHTKEKEKFKVI